MINDVDIDENKCDNVKGFELPGVQVSYFFDVLLQGAFYQTSKRR